MILDFCTNLTPQVINNTIQLTTNEIILNTADVLFVQSDFPT